MLFFCYCQYGVARGGTHSNEIKVKFAFFYWVKVMKNDSLTAFGIKTIFNRPFPITNVKQ